MTITAALVDALGPGVVATDPDILAAHRQDRATWVPAGNPACLVRARTTHAVATALRTAARHRAPVVTRGGGSGLSGGANATDGCVVLSVAATDRVLDIDPVDGVAVIQPGVLTSHLKAAAAEHDLWYPPDPASADFSTIGGNVSTNAGGLCCVKHGPTRHWVTGLEVALADGRVIRTGGRTLASSAGYDLTGLFVGSEGTLGVVTEVTVRLIPRPPTPATMVATFPDLPSAGTAVTKIVRRTTPSLLEIMDRTTVAAVDDLTRMDLDRSAAALVVGQSDAASAHARSEEIAVMEAACRDAGATYATATIDPAEGDLLLNARRLAYSALELKGATLLDDVAVPRSRIPVLLAACGEISARHDVPVATFGHAGAGVLHPTIVFDRDDSAAVEQARRAFAAIIELALSLGGVVTGEHGVGQLKRAFLADQLDGALAVHRAIRSALDPRRQLNPAVAL